MEVVSFDDRVVGFHGWECCLVGGGGQPERRGGYSERPRGVGGNDPRGRRIG